MTDESRAWRRALLTALGLSAAATIALGFSRFAYSLLLPAMQEDLGLSYVEAGALNTFNAVGYLAGAFGAAWAARRWGVTRPFMAGVALSTLALAATAFPASLDVLSALRALGGFFGAFAYILGAALAGAAAPTLSAERRGILLGIYSSGPAAGIVLSGLAAPAAAGLDESGWRAGWLALAALAALGTAAALPAARAATPPGPPRRGGRLSRADFLHILPTTVAYTCFGAGYAGWTTFVIAMLKAQGESEALAARFWIVMGGVGVVSAVGWGRMLGRLPANRGGAIAYATTLVGSLPALIWPGPAGAFASAAIYGGSVMAGPIAMSIVAQRHLAPESIAPAVASMTICFAVGQSAGPILSGWVSDVTGDVAMGLWIAPVLLAGAAVASLFQSPPRPAALAA
ncbi:YbfB/YjiJ family MFS transporter [Albimonas sp. CAU 1670]|uniref:YbfB/YjiJ family MFS transporter n=1 Tax=Albimonas sp. CAU 1670 TaxID=3032599 RepID=UPI0023DA970D|nr:YbfB/YjiJ family MFS transporter [Albimonas sp. CAU 1670]MDF2231972.1 YbfB/YjiJ family MFS transporter [Albimonas sp. CAU 1670]